MIKVFLVSMMALQISTSFAQPVERRFSELFEQRSTATDIYVQVPDDEILVFDGQADGKVLQVRGRTLYIIAKRARVDGTFRLIGRDQVVADGNPDLVPDKPPFDHPADPGSKGGDGGRCKTGGNGDPGKPGTKGDDGDPGRPGSIWIVDIDTIEGGGTLELLNVGGRGGKGQQGQTGGKGGQAGRGGDARAYVPGGPRDCGGFNAGQPGDGGPGGAGGTGGAGGPGGQTFLSQALQRELTSTKTKPRIIVSVVGGPGGEGGNGGIGGDGGEGNDGGSGEREKDGGHGVDKKPKQPDQPKAGNGTNGSDGKVATLEDSPIALASTGVSVSPLRLSDKSARLEAASPTTRTFSISWVSPRYAPCEGVGVAGTFRVYVEGIANVGPDRSHKITSMSVRASSAAFTQADGSVAAKAIVKRNGSPISHFVLTRPTPPAIEPAPKADETRRVYLPSGKSLTLASGDRLHIEASTIARTSSGTCALGTTVGEVPIQ